MFTKSELQKINDLVEAEICELEAGNITDTPRIDEAIDELEVISEKITKALEE
jgi:hypothetical protein